MKNFVCIVCPKGCHLQVEEATQTVTGNACKRGYIYGLEEATHPTRILTSTVRVTNAALPRCPVKLNAPIPKEMINDAMQTLNAVTLQAPVRLGEVVVANVCGTGVDFVATRSM